MQITGYTLETTKIRSTPGGDVLLGAIVKDIQITAEDTGDSWLKLQTVNNLPKGGYVNRQSIKIVGTAPNNPPNNPPPSQPNPKVIRTIEILDDFKFIIDGLPE